MTELFLKTLDMSLSASWIVLAVIAVRLLLKKAPKWVNCALWALVAVRLLCPFSLESAWSLIPELNIPQASVSAEESKSGEISAHNSHSTETIPLGETDRTERYYGVITDRDGNVLLVTDLKKAEPETEANQTQILSTVWMIGIVLMAAYAAISYLRIYKKVKISIELGNGVYLCDYIPTPFILGIAKPKIYLPSSMETLDIPHVLAHERAHVKRKDHWWKPLGYLLLTIHWFNPLLWTAYILLCRDIELACDERVIKGMDVPEKKAYSEALLKCSVPRRMIVACPLAFGEVGVKQRVKSVLHYKKPGFWVILVSVILIIVVAVGFLTDPESHTLANIMEIREKDVVSINVWSHKGRVKLETDKEISDFLAFLDTIGYDSTPAAHEPIAGDMDENDWSYRTIEINYEDTQEVILFDYDYALVWTRDADGTNSLPYPVTGSDILKDFLDDHVTPVLNRYVTAEPFATAEEPGKWLKNIHRDAIKTSRLYVVNPDQTLDSTYLTNAQVAELLEVLNTIPERALSNEQYDDNFDYNDLRYFSAPSPTISGISLTIEDKANELTAVLRLYEDKLELVLVEGVNTSKLSALYNGRESTPARIWSIDHQALRDHLSARQEDPPYLLTFAGSRYNIREEKEIISDGKTTIKTCIDLNWDYKLVQPEDGEDFFGFRCRPKYETEGWITFGWWGDNFVPADFEEEYTTNMYGYHFTYTSGVLEESQSGKTVYNRYYRCHCSHGDFVILQENCSEWVENYRDELSFYYMMLSVHCETHFERTEIPDNIFSDLVNVAYYDWDSIAREIGAEHMTLFNPRYYEDYLFVGCQYEDGYRIACFRKIEGYDYEFVELLSPVSKALPNDSTLTVPVAEFETEDSPWYLYVVEDETVTGVKCNDGFWAYIPVDSSPALVVLDEALWGTDEDSGVAFDLCYDDLPMLDFFTQPNGSIVEFTESYQYYLYSCIVNYNDGNDHLSAFSFDEDELWELSGLLTSLPTMTENVFPEYEEESFELLPEDGNGPRFRAEFLLGSNCQYLWSDQGIIPEDFGAVKLQLYYSDGELVLCVNEADLKKELYSKAYYFKVESPELEEFVLRKCEEASKKTS